MLLSSTSFTHQCAAFAMQLKQVLWYCGTS